MTVTLNHAVIIVGPAEYGKTTIARRDAGEFLATYPNGFVFVHDRHEQFAPDITRVYKDTAEWRAAYAASLKNNTAFARGASFRCASDEVAKLAIELGELHNRAKNVQLPIWLGFDESSLMATSGATWMDKLDFQLFADRRHWGIAPLINTQRAHALMQAFYDQATDVWIFSLMEEDARYLEKTLSLPKGSLASLINAEKYKHVHWVRGKGIV